MFGQITQIDMVRRKLDGLKQNAHDPAQLLSGLKAMVSELESKIPSSAAKPSEKNPAEEYRKNLIESPVFVCCCIPEEAFYAASNSLKPFSEDMMHKIIIGKRDDCGGINPEEKLANALLACNLLPPSGIQVVLKFENIIDHDLFCRDKIAGIKQVKKYYTPKVGKNFNDAHIISKQDLLKLCEEHIVGSIHSSNRRNLLIEKITEEKDFVEAQIKRLSELKANESPKAQHFLTISTNLGKLIKEVTQLSDEQVNNEILSKHERSFKQLHAWLQDICKEHRHNDWRYFAYWNAFRYPKSMTEFKNNTISKYNR